MSKEEKPYNVDFKTISFNPEGIPEALKRCHQWLTWKFELNEDGRLIKVPYSVQGYYRASVTSSKDRGRFDVAYGVFLRNPDIYSGLGFVLTEQDPFFIIDYDHVRDPVTGKFMPGIREEIISANTCAEISQSGTGAHVFGKGTIPGPKRRRGCREIYDSKRFFAITGNHLEGTPYTVNEASEQVLRAIYEKIDPSVKKPQNEVKVQDQEVLENISLADEEVIKLCNNASNSEIFKKLYGGNWQENFNSQSEGDLSLCSRLAFYTKDVEQIDRLFSKSGLYREKWDREEYKRNTITKALEGSVDAKENLESPINTKEKLEVSNQETASKEPYIITEDKIYLNVMDSKGHHMFAYLGDSGKIEYSEYVHVESRTVYPQELPVFKNGKSAFTVGIPKKEFIDSAQIVSPGELYDRIKTHLKKYLDLSEQEIDILTIYILFTWYYRKLNTLPYERFLGDTGKGKTRMLNVTGDVCFYPVAAGHGSSISGVIRFNELWHGTLKVNEVDKSGKMENDLEGYFNSGFEAGNYFVKNSNVDFSKQEWFDPFCPKIFTMKRPFSDPATEGRLISISVRETTNPNIPILLPPSYVSEVEELRALIAKFVIFNWTSVDIYKLSNFSDLPIEPRSKQLAIPLSIILQLLPDKEKAFKDYFLHRQGEVTKIRSESWDGTVFNYVYSLAIGNEIPVQEFENYVVEGNVVAITPSMVARYFSSSAKSISEALKTIGFATESKTVYINDNGSVKGKKTRMYVVPSVAAWREMVQRYLERDSESEEIVISIPECPDVLKAKRFIE